MIGTDTSTLRLLLREACDLLDEFRSHETENFIARVKIALDAQTEQPADLQLSASKVGSPPQDQTAVSTAPDAVAEAAKVLLRDYRALKTLTDYQLRHSAWASTKTIARRGKMVVDALEALAKGHQP